MFRSFIHDFAEAVSKYVRKYKDEEVEEDVAKERIIIIKR